LRKNTDADSVILLKGSRGMALENILTPFIQEINT
jgi:UDP-N-acetylmuramoyl-tripeptide--D-alanyl-D-alanine ligase